ncbi:MAG: fibronectin type III domain-containing protein [Candidatus Nanopelagicales bacterium]|nr:fibronectin type III domain-containing protein [Candidatus Nanopelagicales bacterium]
MPVSLSDNEGVQIRIAVGPGPRGARGRGGRLLAEAAAVLMVAAGLVAVPVAAANPSDPGQFDSAFAANTNGGLRSPGAGESFSEAVQLDGKIVVTGGFDEVAGVSGVNGIARFNADGTSDTSFNAAIAANGGLQENGYTGTGWFVAVQPDGKIVVTGEFDSAGGIENVQSLARFESSGAPDIDFNTAIATNGGLLDYQELGTGWSLVLTSYGKIVVIGHFEEAGRMRGVHSIARFNSDGTPDIDFNTVIATNGGLQEGSGWFAAVQSDGKIVVTGGFAEASGMSGVSGIARFNSDGTPDTGFNTAIAANGGLGEYGDGSSLSVQSDGKVVVIGDFDEAGGMSDVRNLARFNSDGSPDTEFNAAIAANGGVRNFVGSGGFSLAVQADGKIVVSGSFDEAGGMSDVNGIARFDSDGTADTSFNTAIAANGGLEYQGNEGRGWFVAVQLDGKIVVTGEFDTAGGSEGVNSIARFESGGAPDTDFNTNIATNGGLGIDDLGIGRSVAVQSDGKIVVTGDFTKAAATLRVNNLARFNANGIADTAFNTNIATSGGLADCDHRSTQDCGFSVAVQSDGKIVVVGDFTEVGGEDVNRIARFNANGTPDTGFNANVAANGGLDGRGRSVAVQSDGKIVVTGHFWEAGGSDASGIARFESEGDPDTGFNANVEASGGLEGGGWSGVVQSDGRIVVTGDFYEAGGTTVNRLARFNANGTPDTGFNANVAASGGLGSRGRSLAVHSDGKIAVTGGFWQAGGEEVNNLARFNANGTPDTGFNANVAANGGLDDDGWSVAVQSDGKIVVAGDFTDAGGMSGVNGIARLNADGTADTLLNASIAASGGLADCYNRSTQGCGFSVALQSDGKIAVTGDFTEAGGTEAYGIARLYGVVVPGPARSVRGVAGDRKASVSWTAPAPTDGSAITGYRIQRRAGSGAWSTVVSDTGTSTRTRVVTGLSNGTSYTFRVAAINAAGVGTYSSASAAVRPVGKPGKPGKPVVTPKRHGKAHIHWPRSAANGAAVTYQIWRAKKKGNWGRRIATTSGHKWTGSVPEARKRAKLGEPLFFLIRPHNSVGFGKESKHTKAWMKR